MELLHTIVTWFAGIVIGLIVSAVLICITLADQDADDARGAARARQAAADAAEARYQQALRRKHDELELVRKEIEILGGGRK